MIDFSSENLNYLRKNTSLSLKDLIIMKYLSIKKSNSIAESYEYNVRYRYFQNNMFNNWKKFNDGLDIEEFSNKVIIDNINKEKELKLEVKNE